jgi:hypothetical protein
MEENVANAGFNHVKECENLSDINDNDAGVYVNKHLAK